MKISELIHKLQQWPNQDAEVYAYDADDGWYQLGEHSFCEMVSYKHTHYNGRVWFSIRDNNSTYQNNLDATLINAVGLL